MKILKSNVWSFVILSYSAFNSAFVAIFFVSSIFATVIIFLFKQDSLTKCYQVYYPWTYL